MLPLPVRHRWLDPWLTPSGPALSTVTATVRRTLVDHEAATGARQRARRPRDQAAFYALVDLLVANLALAVLDPPPSGALAVRAGNVTKALTRYDHPAFGKQFRPLLASLHEVGLAVLDVSTRRGELSSLAPSAAFAELVRDSGATMADLGRNPDEEVILLHRKLTPREDPSRRERLDYKDTATTRTMRGDLRRINAALLAADVAFKADHPALGVNLSDRRLTRRFFVGPEQRPFFDQGGRLFGGFWQTLPAARLDRGGLQTRTKWEQPIAMERVEMIEEGARVKLRPESRLGRQHPEMLGAVGIVGSIVRGTSWKALGSRSEDRARDVSMHVRLRELNLVALNVPAGDVEAVDHLDPELA